MSIVFWMNNAAKSLVHEDKIHKLNKNNKSKITREPMFQGKFCWNTVFEKHFFEKFPRSERYKLALCRIVLYPFQQNIVLPQTFPIVKLLRKICSLLLLYSKSVPTTTQ